MKLITLIASSDLPSALRMDLVKTAMSKDLEATFSHIINVLTLHITSGREWRVELTETREELTQASEDLTEVRAENVALQEELAAAKAVIKQQKAALEATLDPELGKLPRTELENRFDILQRLYNRETREHKRTYSQLVLAKKEIEILGSLE